MSVQHVSRVELTDRPLSIMLRCPPCTFLPPACPAAVPWAAGTVAQESVQLTVGGTVGTILMSLFGLYKDFLHSLNLDTLKKIFY